MKPLQRIRETDLGDTAREALDAVARGETVVIDGNGQPSAVIVDLTDYRILRAAARYYVDPSSTAIDPENGPSDEAVAALSDPQDRYDLVIAHYLAQVLSLARAGELLGLPWIDIRDRLNRLNLPVWTAPATVEELEAEIAAVKRWMAASRE